MLNKQRDWCSLFHLKCIAELIVMMYACVVVKNEHELLIDSKRAIIIIIIKMIKKWSLLSRGQKRFSRVIIHFIKAANWGFKANIILRGLFEKSGKRYKPLAYNPDFTVNLFAFWFVGCSATFFIVLILPIKYNWSHTAGRPIPRASVVMDDQSKQ